MPSDVLATAGGDIKVWDSQNCRLTHHIPNQASNVSNICWSPDGNWLGNAFHDSDKLLMHFFRGRQTATLELKPEIPQTFVRYGNTSSRLVVSCSLNGPRVCLWDLKTRKVTKQYQTCLNSGITCAAYGHGDTYIACGGRNGAVVLTNVVSSVAVAPMIAPNVQCITGMQYSYLHRELLGTVSEDGACNLWNCNSRALLKSFTSAHLAPASGIAFSPINEMLLLTVGLDKKIVFYDTHCKKVINTQKVEAPLTCLDFTSDGTCVAVGSRRGSVLVFDLRSSSKPLHTMQAHTSVRSLCYKKMITAAKGSIRGSTEVFMPQHFDVPKRDIILSPVLDSPQNKFISNGSPTIQTHEVSSIMDILSPLQGDQSTVLNEPMTVSSYSRLEPVNLAKQELSPWKLSMPNVSIPQKHTSVSRSRDLPSFSTMTPERLMSDSHLTSKEMDSHISKFLETTVIEEKHCTNSACQTEPYENTEVANERPSGDQRILDAIDELQKNMHQDVTNLHFEMLKELCFQQLAIQELAKKCELIDELCAENRRLKQENMTLRKTF